MATPTRSEIYALALPAFTLIYLILVFLWQIRHRLRFLHLACLQFIGLKHIGPFRILSLLEVLGYLIVNTVVILTGGDWYGNLLWMCVFNYGYATWTGHNPLWLKLSPRWGYRMHFCSAFTCLLEAVVHVSIVSARHSLSDYQWVYWTVSSIMR